MTIIFIMTCLVCSILLYIGVLSFTGCLVHIKMNKDDSQIIKNIKGNYKKFVEEFNKQNWEYNNYFESFFVYDYNEWKQISKVHASIYMFNNIGMIIYNPIDFLRIKKFLNNKRKEYSEK